MKSKDNNKKPVIKNHRRKKKKSKYDEKIVVDASFEELMKELVTPKKKD